MNKQPTIFFGASQFVIPIIAFLKEEYDLKFVVTTETSPLDAVPTYCKKNNILCFPVTTLKSGDIIQKLEDAHVTVAVLAYFGLIVPQKVIDIFPKGIINIHPSRLPQYRGTTPIQTALLLGDAMTGVSVMLLDSEVDHGPILGIEEAEILPNDTAVTLYERLFPQGAAMLRAILPAYLNGKLQPQEQDHAKATFTKPLTRDSGYFVDTRDQAPDLLDRMIRAYYPWPGVWTKCTTLPASKLQGKIVKFLPEKNVQVEGKKPMGYKDFLNGYPEAKDWLKKITGN